MKHYQARDKAKFQKLFFPVLLIFLFAIFHFFPGPKSFIYGGIGNNNDNNGRGINEHERTGSTVQSSDNNNRKDLGIDKLDKKKATEEILDIKLVNLTSPEYKQKNACPESENTHIVKQKLNPGQEPAQNNYIKNVGRTKNGVKYVAYRRKGRRFPFKREYPAEGKTTYYDDSDNSREYEVPLYSVRNDCPGVDFLIGDNLKHNVSEVYHVQEIPWYPAGDFDHGTIKEGGSLQVTCYRVGNSFFNEIPYNRKVYNPDKMLVEEESGVIQKDWNNSSSREEYNSNENQSRQLKFEPVIIKDNLLLVGGKSFQIRGLTYSPGTIGQDAKTLHYELAVVKNDVKLMEELGINTVRVYYPIQDKRILDLFANSGIRIIMGIPYYDDRYNPGPDVRSGTYLPYIKKFKKHPAILMWEFGNEYDLLATMHPDWFEGDIRIWHKKLAKAAAKVKSIDPDHPISTAIANNFDLTQFRIDREIDGKGIREALACNLNVKELKKVCESYESVDIIGVNTYAWDDPSILINRWNEISDKPMYLAEAGIDSYDSKNRRFIEDQQAEFVEKIWHNLDKKCSIYDSANPCVGVTFMTFADEWWKYAKDIYRLEPEAGFVHDPVPPDGFANEQCWGWVDARRKRKKVFERMKNLWSSSGESDLNGPRVLSVDCKFPISTNELIYNYRKFPEKIVKFRYEGGKMTGEKILKIDKNGKVGEEFFISLEQGTLDGQSMIRRLKTDANNKIISDVLIDSFNRIRSETVFIGSQRVIKLLNYAGTDNIPAEERYYLDLIKRKNLLWTVRRLPPRDMKELLGKLETKKINISNEPREKQNWKLIRELISLNPTLEGEEIILADGKNRELRFWLSRDFESREIIRIYYFNDHVIDYTISTNVFSRITGSEKRDYKLNRDLDIIEIFEEVPAGQIARTVFSDKIIRSYNKLFNDNNGDLQEDLDLLGITPSTKIGLVKRIPKMIETDSVGNTYFGSTNGNPTYVYYIKNDPRSRNRTIAEKSPSGKVTIFPWWWEGKTISLCFSGEKINNKFPIGIHPGSIQFNEDGNIEQCRFFWKKLSFPYFAGKIAYQYKVIGQGRRLGVIVTPYGKLLAEKSAYAVCKLANGKLGTATLGTEIQFYKSDLSYDVPTVAIVKRIDNTTGKSREFIAKKFLSTRYYSDNDGKQKAVLCAREYHPLAPENIYLQEYEYVDGKLLSKERIDVIDRWFKERYDAGKLLIMILGLTAITFAVGEAGSIFRKFKSKTRKENKPQELSLKDENVDNHGTIREELNRIESFPDYGFDDAVVSKARSLTEAYVGRRLLRGENNKEIADQFFINFRNWYKNVYQHHFKRMENLDFSKFSLEEVYIYNLIYLSTGIFSNSTPSFLNFLFLKTIQKIRQGDERPGLAVREEVDLWTRILENNIGVHKKTLTQDRFITYNDVEDLFRTPIFLRLYDKNKSKIEDYLYELKNEEGSLLNGLIRKTYPDACGGILATRGIWLLIKNLLTPLTFILLMMYSICLIFLPLKIWALGFSGILTFILFNGRIFGLFHKKHQGRYPIMPDVGRKFPNDLKARKEVIIGAFFWLFIIVVKLFWNFFIFEKIKTPAQILFQSSVWGIVGGNYILVLLLLIPFIVFFVLDTFTFFFIGQSIISYIAGKWTGVSCIRTWNEFKHNFDRIKEQFISKIIPDSSGLSQSQKEIAWVKAWNLIIDNLYKQDKITGDEKELYTYVVENDKGDFLDGKVKILPDFSASPDNEEAKKRILNFASSMFMEMPRVPSWDRLYSFSVMVPVYNEPVIYSWEELNKVENTGVTRLTHLIQSFPDEWDNFVYRMVEQGYSKLEISKMKRISPEAPPNLVDQRLIEEIQMWASFRFQPLGRTIRGIMSYVDVLKYLCQLHYPGKDEQFIDKKVKEIFQCVIGYQTFNSLPENDTRRIWLEKFMRMYPFLEVAYLDKKQVDEKTEWFSVLISYDREQKKIVERSRIRLPGKPIVGEGKPCNQNNILRHVRGEKVQFLDANQDLFLGENLKVFNLLEEFRKDNNVKMVGFPETIITEKFSAQSLNYALADEIFTSFVQRFLSLLGIRFHYGHPDFIDRHFISQVGAISPSEVNEDIFGGYKTVLSGGRIIFREYMLAGKAREVSFHSASIFYAKLGMGAMQQGLSRWIRRFFSSTKIPLSKKLSHFMVLGYFLRKPLVVFGIMTYLVLVFFLGVSGFESFPSEVVFGFTALIFAEAIMLTGFMFLLTSRGILIGILDFIEVCPRMILTFMSHIFLFDSASRKGLHGKARYLATGRGWMLNHLPAFAPDESRTDDVYSLFRESYFLMPFACIIMGTLGFTLWHNINMIWSAFFILSPFAAFSAPFFLNPGSLPLDDNYKLWRELTATDWKNWTTRAVSLIKDIFSKNSNRSLFKKVVALTELSIAGVLNLGMLTVFGGSIYLVRLGLDTAGKLMFRRLSSSSSSMFREISSNGKT